MVAMTLAGMLLVQPILPLHNVQAEESTVTEVGSVKAATGVTLVDEQPITTGAKKREYIWRSTRSGKAVMTRAHVVQIDLTNPYVKLDVMTGTNNQFTKKNNVSAMAKETGAVAGVNGDYYAVSGQGAPIGPQVSSGLLMASPSYLTGLYAFAVTKDNKPMIDRFTFTGTVTALDGSSYPLSGVNKAAYHISSKEHSHVNNIYLYTSAWGNTNRANDGSTTPTEVLVENNVVSQISENNSLPIIAPENGYILRAHGKAAEFIKLHIHIGDQVDSSYQLKSLNSNNQEDLTGIKTMIGGHTILVDNGKVSAYSRDVTSMGGYRSRTALGYSQDGRYVYIITVDKKGDSEGMSLSELQNFMISIKVWKGLNLDGGGSTTMVSRPLGEFGTVLVNGLENGSERKVVNGFGVFSTAPVGAVQGISIQGESTLFLNEQAVYTMRAYDQYYNPVDASSMPVKWSTSATIGNFGGNTFVPTKIGKTTLTVTSGTAKESREVEVMGRDRIASMAWTGKDAVLVQGGTYKLPLLVTTKEGRTRTIPPQSVQWELKGFTGKVEGDTLTVDQVKSNEPGYVIGRYDGFSTMITLKPADQRLWTDFETNAPAVSFAGSPVETTGSASVVTGLPGENSSAVLYLQYNVSAGTGTKAAYAVLGDAEGIAIEGKPKALQMDVLGDNSLNWLRAEIQDAAGKLHRVDIAKSVNWTGWRTLNTDLSSYAMTYPIKLKKLYMASAELGQDERAAIGEIAMDRISFQYDLSAIQKPSAKLLLTINKKTALVDGKKMQLDQAPFVIKGVTYLPARFVADALGGSTLWNQTAKQVSIFRGDKLMELWFNQNEYVLNGQRYASATAPTIIRGRTMVPVRLVSEKLGLKVGWDQKTQSVTIE